MNEEKITVDLTGLNWRKKFSQQIGGGMFDEPGGATRSALVLAEERELEKANVPGDPGSALLKLSIADPTWKMAHQAFEAGHNYFCVARDSTRYKDIVGVRRTMDTIMIRDTHEMMANLIQRHHSVALPDGKGLTADWVQYSPGAIKRALAEYIPTLLFETGVNLLFPSPSYQVIKSAMNCGSVCVRDVPLISLAGRWAFDFPQMTKLAVSLGQKYLSPAYRRFVMYVNVPHNPTGMAYTKTDWAELIAWAIEYNVTLVVDEAYIDLCYRPGIVSVLKVPGWERCCIVLQSVSKGWNATGLRFGWIVAHPTVIKALRKVMDVKDSGMFGPSIVAGLYCLLHPEIAQETRARYQVLHRKLADGLQAAGFKGGMPDAGLCQFTPAPKNAIRIRSGLNPLVFSFNDASVCAKWFREYLRISVMHAEAAGGQWLRWAVTLQPVPQCGLPTEESIIDEAVRRLKSVKFEF